MDSKGKMRKFENALNRVIGWVSIVSYAGFFFIMALTVIDVFMRFAFNNPILGSYEIIERTVFCGVFASFAYAQMHKSHIRITMLVRLFPRVLRYACVAFTGFLSAAIVLAMAYAAVIQARTAFTAHYVTGVLKIPLYPFYWIEGAMMFAFFVTLLFDAVKSMTAIFDEKAAREIQSTWD
ncbi:MAG: TRAP transporter small permease [Planctomycetota bacterium]|jgi:TRAP-type C4-dicarboxylate transport system permease small subunit|nr:TRAP transporter small permease [Planctomycetota bacterium]